MIYDIAIIGAGSVGSFAAYYASKDKNKKICLLDRFSGLHSFGSYHGDTRIFRIAYGEGSKYISLLQKAYDLWGDFEKENKTKVFERLGMLNAGNKDSPFMQNILSSIDEFKLDTIKMNAKQIYKAYGIRVPDDFLGVLEQNTGFIYSDLSVKIASAKASKNDTHCVYGIIKHIIKKQENYEIILQTKERIQAKSLLICVGSYVQELLSTFDFEIPPVPTRIKRKIVHWYDTNGNYQLKNGLAAFILEFQGDHFYGFSDFGDGLKIGRDKSGIFINTREERVDFGSFKEDFSEIEDHVKNFFPKLAGFKKGGVCTYPMSLDDDFIIDFLDENIFFIGGLSHGFKFAPYLAKLGLKSLTNKNMEENIQKYFSLKRFSR